MVASEPVRGSEVVLVVDDDPTVLKFCATALTHYGYKIVTASSGRAGLFICEQQPIELALIDVMMPGMNGVDLLKTLHIKYPQIRTLLMSGYSAKDIKNWIQTDVSQYRLIWKPFRAADLARSIRNVLDAPSPDGAVTAERASAND